MRRNQLAVLLAALVAPGCIHTDETVIKDDARRPVEFENDTAARVFYEALSKIPGAGQKTESHTEVSIPVVFSHERKTLRGPNAAFNDAVMRCDTNQDARITESEARIFAGTVP
jgi:hypothetical protein